MPGLGFFLFQMILCPLTKTRDPYSPIDGRKKMGETEAQKDGKMSGDSGRMRRRGHPGTQPTSPPGNRRRTLVRQG